MEYCRATKDNIHAVYELVQNTIKTVYPKYYPREVIDFFCALHNKENIEKDIQNGTVSVLIVEGQLAGTGSYESNHITRVYVDPLFQGRGYGSYIMQKLEDEIALHYDAVFLDASLPASHLYETRGYTTVRHEKQEVENNAVLVYEVMQKNLNRPAP